MVQYFPHLIENGFKLDFRPLLVDNYLIKKYNKNIAFGLIINAYIKRILKLISLNKYDLIWLEKELIDMMALWGYFEKSGAWIKFSEDIYEKYCDD